MTKKTGNIIIAIVFTVSLLFCIFGLTGAAGKYVLPSEQVVPQIFTFGNVNLGDHTDLNDANAKSASPFTSSQSGSLQSITALGISRVNSAGYVMAAVYSGDVSYSGSLLEQSAPVYVGTSDFDATFAFNVPISVSAGQTYSLALMSDDYLNVWINSGVGSRIPNFNNYASGFSDPYGYVYSPHTDGAMSIYATCTAASTPTATPIGSTPTSTPTASPLPTASPIPTPTPLPKETLTLQAGTGGTVAAYPTGTPDYNLGSSVTITATPNNGYTFSYWLMGDNSKVYSASTTLSMTNSKSALAVFNAIPQVTPTPAPGTTAAPTPLATGEPTPIPVATPISTPSTNPTAPNGNDVSDVPINVDLYFAVFGLAGVIISVLAALWYNKVF